MNSGATLWGELPGIPGQGNLLGTEVRHHLGTTIILGHSYLQDAVGTSPGSSQRYLGKICLWTDIRGSPGVLINAVKGSLICKHTRGALGIPRKTCQSWAPGTHPWGLPHLHEKLLWELSEPLLGSQHSGGPSRGLRHPAWSVWGRIQWNLRITTHGTFLPTGPGAFWHPFWYWKQHPSPYPMGTNLLLRPGNSFVEVTIKTCWPGGHCNPVWWPAYHSCAPLGRKLRFKPQKASFCPSFRGLCYPLTIYRNKGQLSQSGWPVWRKECAGSPGVQGAPRSQHPALWSAAGTFLSSPDSNTEHSSTARSLQSWEMWLRNPFENKRDE